MKYDLKRYFLHFLLGQSMCSIERVIEIFAKRKDSDPLYGFYLNKALDWNCEAMILYQEVYEKYLPEAYKKIEVNRVTVDLLCPTDGSRKVTRTNSHQLRLRINRSVNILEGSFRLMCDHYKIGEKDGYIKPVASGESGKPAPPKHYNARCWGGG